MAPPVMKTFKEFLLSLDDAVDETEAVKRYNDYKLDFRRQQMQDFFLAHKDEEWYVGGSSPPPPKKAPPRSPAATPLRPTLLNQWAFGMGRGGTHLPPMV